MCNKWIYCLRFCLLSCVLSLLPAVMVAHETPTGFRLEMIVYEQPKKESFGNIQPNKYVHFVNKASSDTPYLPKNAYEDTHTSAPMQRIKQQLKRRGLSYNAKSWIVGLEKQQATTLPLSMQLQAQTDAQSNSEGDTQGNFTKVFGHLLLTNNHYVDIDSHLVFEVHDQGNITLFDAMDHQRHLKLDRIQYLDHETLGIVVRVSHAPYTPKISQETLNVENTDATSLNAHMLRSVATQEQVGADTQATYSQSTEQ